MYPFGIFKYIDLIKVLVSTQLKVKYKSNYLGFFWSILNPLLMMVILSFVFTLIIRADIRDDYPNVAYPVFLLLGQVFWRFFQMGTNHGMQSVIMHSGIIKRVYFPREIVVVASVLASLFIAILELLVFFGVLGLFQLYFYHTSQALIPVHVGFVFIFVFLGMTALLVLGLSFFLASIYVRYRDINEIWQVVTTAGFFLTPIIYSVSFFSQSGIPWVNPILTINPLARLIPMSRRAIFLGEIPGLYKVFLPFSVILLVLVAGIFYFRSREKTFRQYL